MFVHTYTCMPSNLISSLGISSLTWEILSSTMEFVFILMPRKCGRISCGGMFTPDLGEVLKISQSKLDYVYIFMP